MSDPLKPNSPPPSSPGQNKPSPPISPPLKSTTSSPVAPVPPLPPSPQTLTPPIAPPAPVSPIPPPITPSAPPPISPPNKPPPIDTTPAALPPPPVTGGPNAPIPPPPPADSKSQNSDSGNGNVKSSIFKKSVPILGGIIALIALFFLVTRVILPRFAGPKEPDPVALTYWGLWEETPIIRAAITDYQTQNPHVTINYQQQSHKDYRERLQSTLARGGGPDLFRFHNTWVPMLKGELTSIPATVFDNAAFAATFYPVAQKDLVSAGNIVGVPLMIDGLGLYYNKSLFTDGGKSPPTNWEELRQTAFDLTVRDESGKIQTAGIALGTTSNVEHWPDIMGLMLLQNGADPAAPTGATAVDAIRFYTIFSLTDRVWDDTLPSSVFAFATEKVAMIFAPSWQAHTIKEINPNIDFGIVPVPQLPSTNITWASYWVEGVSQKSPNQDEAFKLLKFLSEKNTLIKLYSEASKTRLFGEPYSRKDMADVLASDDLVGPFIAQAETAQSFYLASRTFDNGINDKVIKYYEDAINAVNEGEDAQKTLQTVAQGVAQVLSQYGIVSN